MKYLSVIYLACMLCLASCVSAEPSPLHKAAKKGNLEEFKKIYNKKAYLLKTKDKLEHTPYETAIVNGNLEIVKYLYELGERKTRYPILDSAVNSGNPKMVEFFLDRGHEIKEQRESSPYLIEAVKRNHIEVVKLLLKRGAKINVKKSGLGESPIHNADSPEMLELLIKNGADIQVKDNTGDTPLFSITDPETLKLLIKKGADVNALSKNNENALHSQIIRLAWYNNEEMKPYLELIKTLIDKGINVNQQEKTDLETPLHKAAAINWRDAVKLLIKNGAKINVRKRNGFTPLHNAVYRNCTASAKALIDAGANVNTIAEDGSSPLDTAIWRKNQPLVDYLKKHGAKTAKELQK
jgi:ankyrin repeat protein